MGDYRLGERLGEGGMGVVYRAQHDQTGRPVALKVARGRSTESFAGIRAEVRALAGLAHPGIVKIVESGHQQGVPWYAMELLEGRNAADLVDELWGPRGDRERADTTVTRSGNPGPSPSGPAAPGGQRPVPGDGRRPPIAAGRLPEVMGVLREVCEALAYLHGVGLRHGDLKPRNVFMTRDGRARLLDFGLAARNQGALGRESLDRAAALGGTLVYLAPEQLRGEPTDARTDLYAFGVLMFEMLAGRLPFLATRAADLIVEHGTIVPPRLTSLVSGVPDELDDLVARLLAGDPRERIGYAEDVAAVLAAVGAPEPDLRDDGQSTAHLLRPRLHGRDGVLGSLGEACANAMRGTGALWLVGGESGVGKTSLIAEASRRAARGGATVVTGECVQIALGEGGGESMPAAPLAAFREVLRHVADRCHEQGESVTARLLGRRLKLLARFEPVLLTVPGADRYGDQPELPAPSAQERVVREMMALLAALAAENPLVVIIDDLQWADPLSMAVIGTLADQGLAGLPLLMLGAYRNDEMTPELGELRRHAAAHDLTLPRLDETSLVEMVGGMLGTAQPPAELVRFLARHSEGNPFFAAEYLRTAVAEGRLLRVGGRWQLKPQDATQQTVSLDDLALPRTLDEIVARRLFGLAPDEQHAVNMAAVLGRELDLPLLAAVTGLAPSALAIRLREPVARGVLTIADAATERYRFVHDKLREGVYRRIPRGDLPAVHRAAAQALENQAGGAAAGADPAQQHYPALIHHWKMAGDSPRAVDWMERAGEAALLSSAHKAAAHYFEQAIATVSAGELPVANDRLVRWERMWGDALQGLGDIQNSRVHLERALALLGKPVPGSRGGLLRGLAGKLARQVGRQYWPASPRDTSALPLLEGARAHEGLLQAYYYAGDDLRMLNSTLGCLDLAEPSGPSRELVIAFSNAHAVAGLLRMTELAERLLARARAVLAEAPGPVQATYVWMQEGHFRAGLGEFDQADRLFADVVRVAKEIGYVRRREEGSVLAAATLAMQGRFDDALVAYDEIFRSALRGDVQVQCWALMGRANVLLGQDRVDEAQIEVRQAQPLTRSLGRNDRLWVAALQATCAMRRGETVAALEYAEAAMKEMRAGPPVMPSWIDPYCHVADVYLQALAHGASGTAARSPMAQAATRACKMVAQVSAIFPAVAGRTAIYLGKLAWLEGRSGAARRHWARAAEGSARRAKIDAAVAALYGALALPEADYERPPALRAARALLGQWGAKHALAASARETLPDAFF